MFQTKANCDPADIVAPTNPAKTASRSTSTRKTSRARTSTSTRSRRSRPIPATTTSPASARFPPPSLISRDLWPCPWHPRSTTSSLPTNTNTLPFLRCDPLLFPLLCVTRLILLFRLCSFRIYRCCIACIFLSLLIFNAWGRLVSHGKHRGFCFGSYDDHAHPFLRPSSFFSTFLLFHVFELHDRSAFWRRRTMCSPGRSCARAPRIYKKYHLSEGGNHFLLQAGVFGLLESEALILLCLAVLCMHCDACALPLPFGGFFGTVDTMCRWRICPGLERPASVYYLAKSRHFKNTFAVCDVNAM